MLIPVDRAAAWGCPWRRAARRRVSAWRYTSWMACPDQFAFSWKVWSVLTIFSARVGHRVTHRWQLTHLLSSASIICSDRRHSGARSLAHWRSHTRQAMQRSVVAHHLIVGIEHIQRHALTLLSSLSRRRSGDTTTGSPPRGAHSVSSIRLHHADGALLAGDVHGVALSRPPPCCAASAGRSRPSCRP